MPTESQAAWQKAADREKRKPRHRATTDKRSQRASTPAPPLRGRRLRVVYDVDGPRVRLGIGWFVLNIAAIALGPVAIAALYAATAAIAALQTARTWRKAGTRPNRVVAGVGAAAVGVAGLVTTGLVGLAILGTVGAALFAASGSRVRNRKADPIVDGAFTIRCALFAGFAAACVVIASRFELGSVVGLVFIVAAYETGDYLVGSGSSNAYEGPAAGITAIVVMTFAVAASGIQPFDFPAAFVFGALAAVLCPAGQLLASAILPAADAPASALRRLDSLLLLAPAWAFAVGLIV